MGWTDPITVAPLDSWTAADWNTYIRDNLNWLNNTHACRVYNSTNQTGLTTSGQIPITFDSELFDADGFHTPGDSKLIVPAGLDGFYTILGTIVYTVNSATGIRDAQIIVNGTYSGSPPALATGTLIADGRQDNPSATANVRVAVQTTFPLSAGDYVELVAFHTTGSNQTANGGDLNQTQLSLVREAR